MPVSSVATATMPLVGRTPLLPPPLLLPERAGDGLASADPPPVLPTTGLRGSPPNASCLPSCARLCAAITSSMSL